MSTTGAKRSLFRSWLLTICIGLPSSLAFFWLAETVRHGNLSAWETVIAGHIQRSALHSVDTLIHLVALSGDIDVVVVCAVITVLALKRKQRMADAFFVTITIVGVVVLNLVVRTSVQRPLLIPDESFAPTFESGFPSSQAADTFALAYVLTILFWPTRWRWTTVTSGVVYVLAIGLSRIHLGMQFPSDILGGWLLALVWISLVNFRWQRHAQSTETLC